MRKKVFYTNKLNSNLEIMLRGIIKESQYHEFTDVLIEIMLRRQSEFNLPVGRMIAEAENLVRSLPAIMIVPNSQLANPRWSAQSGPDGIKIGYDSYKYVLSGDKYRAESLYETLTHEVYHSIAMNDRGGTAFSNNQFESRGLNELINEAAANRAARNYSNDEKRRGIRRTDGYNNLTRFSPLIARCFGLTEKEFLAAGISIRGEYALLDQLLNGTQNYDQRRNSLVTQKGKNLIKSVSYQVELLHNIDIPMKRSQVIPENRKPEYRTAALTGLINNLIDMVNFRIENNINYPDKNMVEGFAYTYKGIVGFVNEILNQYQNENLISPDQVSFIKQQSETRLFELAKRVVGLKEASDMIRRGINPQMIPEMVFLAKTGQLMTPQNAGRFGIQMPQNMYGNAYQINTDKVHRRVLREDFGPRYWYNGPVCEEVQRIFEERSRYLRPNEPSQQKKSFFDKVKDFFRKLRGNQPKELPDPEFHNIPPELSNFDPKSRVKSVLPSQDFMMRNSRNISKPSAYRPGYRYTGPQNMEQVSIEYKNKMTEMAKQYTNMINTIPDNMGGHEAPRAHGLVVEEIHTDGRTTDDKQNDGR